MLRAIVNRMRYAPLVLATIAAISYALVRGSDYNYDFVNIKGQLGWSILHRRLNVDTQNGDRLTFPPFNDVWNVLLLGTGHWWLPVLFWAIVHSLILLVAFFVIKELAPKLNVFLQQVVAISSLTSPLILMQLGTAIGHLATSLFFGCSFLYLLRGMRISGNRYWLLAGASLGFAILLRFSSIPTIPAYFFAVSLIAINGSQLVSFLLGFGWIFFGVSIPWAWYSSNLSGIAFEGIQVIPMGVAGVWVVIVLLCTSPILLSPINRYSAAFHRLVGLQQVMHLIRLGLFVSVGFMVQKIYLLTQGRDPRFLITNFAMAENRLVHTGSLVDGCCQVDLEVSYFDIRVQIATAILIFAVGVFLYRRSQETLQTVGAVTFVVLPILMAISYSGYIRYASQALPLVPLAFVAVLVVLPMKVRLFHIFLVFGVSALIYPVVPGLPKVVNVPRYAQLGDSQNLLSVTELEMANDLIPESSTVFIGGRLVSLLAQQLNRQDLVWTWSQPSKSQIRNSGKDHFVLYNPMEPFTSSQAAVTGISISECSVLRFQRLQLTICRLKE